MDKELESLLAIFNTLFCAERSGHVLEQILFQKIIATYLKKRPDQHEKNHNILLGQRLDEVSQHFLDKPDMMPTLMKMAEATQAGTSTPKFPKTRQMMLSKPLTASWLIFLCQHQHGNFLSAAYKQQESTTLDTTQLSLELINRKAADANASIIMVVDYLTQVSPAFISDLSPVRFYKSTLSASEPDIADSVETLQIVSLLMKTSDNEVWIFFHPCCRSIAFYCSCLIT